MKLGTRNALRVVYGAREGRAIPAGAKADPELRDPIKVVRCWALMETVHDLPVVFRTRADAEENADDEEQLFQVEVHVLKRVTKRRRAFRGIP